MKKLCILVSGRGTNMQSLIEASAEKRLDATIALVLSNKEEAPALEKARRAGIATAVVNHREYESRESFEEKMAEIIDSHGVDFVILAGFMRVLTPLFIRHYKGRIINIHPALLPSFPGVNAQKQAFEYGVKWTGVTVHFVDEGVDTGPIIAQMPFEIKDGDTVESLAERMLAGENRLFPEAVQKVVSGKYNISGRRVIFEE
ncbi:MAG: phosphoribosylglycinamide formyltransferase [Deltaproteobacteria bacterium]|nr:phosphoribosylglycinamide formyltransferase [Deltaproteobacteria bacterium]